MGRFGTSHLFPLSDCLKQCRRLEPPSNSCGHPWPS
jgi:hypothetical protein